MNPAPASTAATDPCLDADQLKVFRGITLEYFAKLAPDAPAPSIGEVFLKFEEPVLLDYTSLVRISGGYQGCIYFTAPASLVEELLRLHEETDVSDHTRADMCRELSNVLSGNASQAFGAAWNISVPQSILPDSPESLDLPPATFVMPVQWDGRNAFLVIGLTRTPENPS